MQTGAKVQAIRTLKIYDIFGKPAGERVEKGEVGRVMGFVFPWETKRDVLFDNYRMFLISKKWLKPRAR